MLEIIEAGEERREEKKMEERRESGNYIGERGGGQGGRTMRERKSRDRDREEQLPTCLVPTARTLNVDAVQYGTVLYSTV